MAASRGLLKLAVRPGEVVAALWEGSNPIESLREFFNRDIVLEGMAFSAFRESAAG
jgi:hypothetical protein